MVCLDTSFIIDILRGDESAITLKEELEKTSEGITIATPTIIELIRGLNSVNVRKDEKDTIHHFVRNVPSLSLDKESALISGNIDLDLTTKGEKIQIEDVMIAAIVLSNNEVLLTKNIKHFSRIDGLNVQGY